MSRRVLLVLALLVVALSAVRFVQRRERARDALPEARPFPAFEPARVASIEVEHLEKGFLVALEQDAAGRWWMTEPVAYPAQSAAVAGLFDLFAELHGLPVEEPRLAALGLDPPRAVVRWRGADGARGRLEIGAYDVDGARAYVRAETPEGARVLLARRDFASRVDLERSEYRDPRATPIPGSAVISFRRRGAVADRPGEPERDLALDALLEPGRGWVASAPFVAALDPVQMGFVVRGAAELRVDGYHADDVVDLARFGLDEPRIEIALEAELGDRAVLRFAPLGDAVVEDGGPWLGCREGFPFVWRIASRSIGLLSAPALELVDRLFVRAQRDEIVAVRLGDVRLERDGERFTVVADGQRLPADPAAAADLLARLEFARVERYDPALALGEAAVELAVELKDGRVQGGRIAPGGEGRPATYQRSGDELVGEISADVASLAHVRASDLVSRRAHALEEHRLDAVEVESAGAAARFERDPERGTWSRAGREGEAGHGFYAALERLLLLEGEAWADAPRDVPEDAVRVRFEGGPAAGAASPLVLVEEPDGRALCVLPGGRALVVDPSLARDLRALLQ